MFRGCFTALVTPFKNGELDIAAFRSLVKRQVEAGINGLVPLGTTGETATLTSEEWSTVLRVTLEEAKGKAPVIPGVGNSSTRLTLERAHEAKEAGADGLLVVTPPYLKPSAKGLLAHFGALNDEVGLPMMVYNIAGRTGRNIDTPTLVRLAELEHVAAVKEASMDINQVLDVIQQLPDFPVLSGDDALTLPLIAAGGHGVVSVASNVLPESMIALAKHALEGRLPEAQKLHRDLMPLFRALFMEPNPQPVKVAMAQRNLLAEEYRLPLCEMEEANRRELLDVLLFYQNWKA